MTRSHKIGWLVLVIAVLFMLWRLPRLHGQGFGSFSHDQPFLAKDLSSGSGDIGQGGTQYYWVSSDMTNGTVTNWVDRVSGSIFASPFPTNGSGPTNTADGLVFGAKTKNILTNTPFGASATNNGFGWIVKPSAKAGGVEYNMLMVTPGLAQLGFYIPDVVTAAWFGNFNGSDSYTAVYNHTVIHDISLVFSNTIVFVYTNGVLSKSWSGGTGGGYITFDGIAGETGTAEIYTYSGKLYEMIVNTNVQNPQTFATWWHNKATNTYTY